MDEPTRSRPEAAPAGPGFFDREMTDAFADLISAHRADRAAAGQPAGTAPESRDPAAQPPATTGPEAEDPPMPRSAGTGAEAPDPAAQQLPGAVPETRDRAAQQLPGKGDAAVPPTTGDGGTRGADLPPPGSGQPGVLALVIAGASAAVAAILSVGGAIAADSRTLTFVWLSWTAVAVVALLLLARWALDRGRRIRALAAAGLSAKERGDVPDTQLIVRALVHADAMRAASVVSAARTGPRP
jgi:hypothetical protein